MSVAVSSKPVVTSNERTNFLRLRGTLAGDDGGSTTCLTNASVWSFFCCCCMRFDVESAVVAFSPGGDLSFVVLMAVVVGALDEVGGVLNTDSMWSNWS